MSDKIPSRTDRFRLIAPVRLGAVAVAACFSSLPALSNPVNPTVVNGTASFHQAGSVLTVTNSNGAIINWDKFSIKAGETTHFAQTSASSSVLNRVLANDPTTIYGTLSSNGRVWLVNPAGIMVGAGGRVDVAGFVASTLNISNADFLAGRNLFANDGGAKNVINQGEIRTPSGGSVYLVGSNVSNEGIIHTPAGETILAAGQTVSLIDSATPGVKVDITGAAGNATNLGQIAAEAGRIGIAGVIVRNSGTLNASSVVSDGGRIFLKASQDVRIDGSGRIVANGARGGEINVEAEDTASIRGRIEAAGVRGNGGAIDILGDKVGLFDNAYVDASGAFGGGKLRIGGDYQGANVGIRNAAFTYVGRDTTLKADSTGVGTGGTAIVWADGTTRAYGSISAQGGVAGGDGGLVEVSGKRNLDFVAQVRVGARGPGAPGTLLLDPEMLWIADFGGFLPQLGEPTSPFAAITAGIATISPASLAAVGGNISLAATKELVIDDPITLTAAGASLTGTSGKLLAVTPGSTITTNNGAVSLTGGTVAAPTSLDTTDFPLTGPGSCASASGCYANGSLLIMAPVNSGGGAINLVAQNGNLYLKDAVSSGGGAISMQAGSSILSGYYAQPVSGTSYYHTGAIDGGAGSLSLSASTLQLEGSIAAGGGIAMTASGSISNSAATNFGTGSLSMTAPSGISSYSLVGSGTVSASSTSGSIYLNSTTGGLRVASATAGGTVQINASGNLVLGNISGSNVYLGSTSGAVDGIDAASKVTGGYVDIGTQGLAGRVGSFAQPMVVDATTIDLTTESSFNIQIPAVPTRALSSVRLYLDAGGLGATSSIAGGPVLGSGLAISSAGSLVTASVNPVAALSNFYLTVYNGDLTLPTITNVGSMNLRSDGALNIATATGTGSSSFTAQSYNSTVSLGTVTGVGSVYVDAATGITLGSVTGTYADLSTNSGDIVAATDNTGYEIDVGTGTAYLYTYNGSIGGANSFDLRSGSTTLYASGAGAIGTVAKPLVLASTSTVTIEGEGSFNVVGKDAIGTLLSFSRLSLYMRAGGMGSASSIVSANFPIGDFAGNAFAPTSDGTTITLPDLTNHSFTSGLNLYVTDPGGSGLGNVALGQVQAAAGSFYLDAPGSVTQMAGKHIVMGTKAVSIYADGALALGDISAGNTYLSSYNSSLALGTASSTYLNASAAGDLTATAVTSSGNAYLSANSGNLSVGDVGSGSYLELYAGNTLNAGNLTSTYSVDVGAGGAVTVGNVTTPSYAYFQGDSVTLGRATTAANGNISSLQIYSQQSFTDANVLDQANGLKAGTLTISAYAPSGYSVDLQTTPVVAPTVTLNGGNGDLRAALTGTTTLTLSTGGMFDITTTAPALSSLSVAGHAAGIGSSSLTGTAQQSFSFSGGNAADLVVSTTASSSLNLNLEVSQLGGYNVALNNVATYGGSVNAIAYDGGLTASNVNTLNGASVGGNIDLYAAAGPLTVNSVATSSSRYVDLVTDGGNLSATGVSGGTLNLRAGSGSMSVDTLLGAATTLEAHNDITLGSVTTTNAGAAGGALVARSYVGSITNPASNSLAVGTASVTLESWSGSVGSAANPIAIQTTSNLSQLHVMAKDDIAIDVLNALGPTSLGHLEVNFNGAPGASPVLAINATNLPANFLTRTAAGDVTVNGGATPGLMQLGVINSGGGLTLAGDLGSPLQNVTLQSATDMAINGNIVATGVVTLNVGNDLLIAASGGPRTVSGSAINLDAGRDIQLAGGASAGESLALSATGSMNVEGRDFWVHSGAGGASVSSGSLNLLSGGGGTRGLRIEAEQAAAAVSSTGSQYIYAGNGVAVLGGTATGAAASLAAGGTQYLYAYGAGAVAVAAGNVAGASALISAGQNQYVQSYYGTFSGLSVTAGNAVNAFARLSAGQSQSVAVGNSGIQLSAASTEGASAEMTATSQQQISAGTGGITLTGGSSANAANLTYARIRNSTNNGQTVSTTGAISLVGGGDNSATTISNLGAGNQSLSATAISLATLASSTGTSNLVAVEQLNATGRQFVAATGVVGVYNDYSPGTVRIAAAGKQDVAGASIDVRTGASNANGGSKASIEAAGIQSVWARSLLNVAALGLGTASIETSGLEQSVGAMSFSPTGGAPTGDLILGAATAQGTSKILSSQASGFQEVIAGTQLSVLAGAAGSVSKIDAVGGTQVISVLAGGLTMNGSSGGASIDPLTQSIILNGSASLTNATISGDTTAFVVTQGNVTLVGSSFSSPSLTLVSAGDFSADAASSIGSGGSIYYGGAYSNSGTVAPGMAVSSIPVYGSGYIPIVLISEGESEIDLCAISPDLCKLPDPGESPLGESAPSIAKGVPGENADGTDGSFGGGEEEGKDEKDKKKVDEAKDGKKDDKRSQKRVAQCT